MTMSSEDALRAVHLIEGRDLTTGQRVGPAPKRADAVTREDLVRGFLFRYKWKGKRWITLEVLSVKHDYQVVCTPPTTNHRHRYILLENVLAFARKLK